MNESLSDLRDQVKKAFEPRDMDTLFHQRLTSLEGDLGDFKSEVNMLLGQAMEGAGACCWGRPWKVRGRGVEGGSDTVHPHSLY